MSYTGASDAHVDILYGYQCSKTVHL